jgi:prolyl 4-hydroxylase
MSADFSIKQRADRLAAEGKADAALDLLEQAAAKDDPDALFALGAWLGSGQHTPRDLERARNCFERAAEAGNLQADTVLINFLGNGTGGPRDWTRAVARLRSRAETDPRSRFEIELIDRMNLDTNGDPQVVPEGRQLSTSPWVQLYPGLFSEGECTYLGVAAAAFLQPATVIDNATGKALRNPIRTSHTAQLTPPLESLVVHALNRRLAAVTRTGVEQGEPLQILRYSLGQEYKTHIDAIPSLDNQRILTALVYLNDGYAGGETRFVATGGTVRGRTGTGLVFRNVDDAGHPDKQAAHCGMPVTKGVKLLASRWIRERPYVVP